MLQIVAADVTTRFGAAAAGWAYPASMAEIATVVSVYGKQAARVTPWGLAQHLRRREAVHVSDAERAEATAQLASISIFRGVEGFTTDPA